MPTPSTWQTGSVKLKRAGDGGGLSRVAGLEFGLRAPAAAWPMMTVRGGVRKDGSYNKLRTVADTGDSNYNGSFRTVSETDLGAISIPGQAVPTITEASSWAHIELTYGSEFVATLSRMTPAALLELSATSLRMCAGNITKRTTTGTGLTEVGTALSLPKYVAFHTAAGYQVRTLSSTPIDLTAGLDQMDQPWLMVWWGNQSHWTESTKPMSYMWAGISSTQGLPQRYAYQADCPLLLVFSANPTAIVQAAGQGGFDLTLPVGAKKISSMPLYGRLRQVAPNAGGSTTNTTEAWGAALPSAVTTKIAAWYPRLGWFPRTVVESYAYITGTDTTTITETITWAQVLASGGTKFCPLQPVLAAVRATSLSGLTTSGTVVDGDVPTEYGPTQGIVGVDAYTWSMTGLAASTTGRTTPGSGTVPAALQARLDAEVDKLVSQPHWQPWFFANRMPNNNPGGDWYWSNPADGLALASELVPLVSGARQTSLIAWLAVEKTAYPPETAFRLTETAGTARGPFGVPGTYTQFWTTPYAALGFWDTRQWLVAAWGLARWHQETGAAIGATEDDTLVLLIDTDMAEQDWATGHWFNGSMPRQTAVESQNRHWAGLAGLAWILDQTGHTDEGLVRCLLAKSTITRVAMTAMPRWQASVGLITIPTDLGSSLLNAEWLPGLTPEWGGHVFTFDWTDSSDDPRCVVFCDQFHVWLDDGNYKLGHLNGVIRAYQPPYRGIVHPLAVVLDAAVPGQAEIYAQKVRELQPHAWVPHAEAFLGMETIIQPPADSYGLFLSRAWLESAAPADLAVEAAYPWLASGGDLFTAHKLAEAARSYAALAPPPGPIVSNLTDNRTLIGGSAIPAGSEFEITFDLETVATRTKFPYDATWGIDGVTLDCEFSLDGFATTWKRAAFYWEEWEHNVYSSQDHLYPSGVTGWKVRFEPPSAGAWQYRLTGEDDDGVMSPTTPVSFTVVANATYKGPVRRSLTDPRYFEYANGELFVPVGYNMNFTNLSFNDPVTSAAAQIVTMGANGINCVRVWPFQWGIDNTLTSVWWHAHQNDSEDTFLYTVGSDPTFVQDGDQQMGLRVYDWTFPALGSQYRAPAVKPSTTYRVRMRYRLPAALTTPLVVGQPHGLTLKTGGIFPFNFTTIGAETNHWTGISPTVGNPIITPITASTGSAVAEATGTVTTVANQRWLTTYLYAVCTNVGRFQPIATIYEVAIEEDLGGGNYGPNILSRGDLDLWANVDQRQSKAFDIVVAAARANGVTILATTLEKEDQFISRIDAAGVNGNTSSETRFYGTGSGQRVRFLHKANARYYDARWGHSSAIFAWEYINEGDPNLSQHAAGAEAYITYLKSFTGSRKMGTTSTFNSMPASFWNAIPSADFLTWHLYQSETSAGSGLGVQNTAMVKASNITGYLSTDWADSANWVARLSTLIGPLNPTYGMGKPVLLEEGTITDVDKVGPGYSNQTYLPVAFANEVFHHKRLWAQSNAGGVFSISEWAIENTVINAGMPFDRRPVFKRWADWIRQFPVNNGLYVDAAATVPTGLRSWGQKDLTANRAHGWVDNTQHTWYAVRAGTTPTPRSGNVVLTGFDAGGYTLVWTNPYTGGITQIDGVTVSGTGIATLILPAALSTDIAYTLEPASNDVTGTVAIVLPSTSFSGEGQNMVSLDTTTRNAAVDAAVAVLNVGDGAGQVRIYDGTPPADVATALSGNTLLATLTFSDPAFTAAVTGVATASTITSEAAADATGTATFARLGSVNAGTFTARQQLTVGTSGAEMNLNTTAIVTNATVAITSMTETMPAS